jgi:hypothetical protein
VQPQQEYHNKYFQALPVAQQLWKQLEQQLLLREHHNKYFRVLPEALQLWLQPEQLNNQAGPKPVMLDSQIRVRLGIDP